MLSMRIQRLGRQTLLDLPPATLPGPQIRDLWYTPASTILSVDPAGSAVESKCLPGVEAIGVFSLARGLESAWAL